LSEFKKISYTLFILLNNSEWPLFCISNYAALIIKFDLERIIYSIYILFLGKDMNGMKLKSGLILGIVVLLLTTSIVPQSMGQTNTSTQQQKITTTSSPTAEKTSTFTFYVIGKNGLEKQETMLSISDALKIYEKYQELKKETTSNPYSQKTQRVQQEFFDLLIENHATPTGMTTDQLLTLVQPPAFTLNHLRTSILPFQNKASEWFCNFATFGDGSAFPIIILPRLIPFLLTPIPRAFIWWSTPEGITSVGGLISGTGFLAGGQQKGIALGFWGIGFSIFLPPIRSYGIFGYAFYTRVTAEEFQFYPPNYSPEITQTDPADGQQIVPISTTELRFEINDANGDLMSYNVTTEPDIGSGSGGLKPDGTYSVPVSGLESLVQYTWYIQVTDGKDTTEKTLMFTTEPVAPVISNPSPSDGERHVPTDLQQLQFTLKDFQGDAMDYTVETSPFIGSGSGIDVHNGTYIIAISGLENSTTYRWYINATDGTHWTRKTFRFQTGFPAHFDPFEHGWNYRKQITIDHTNIPEDLTNFPVLVNIVDNDLKDKAQPNGDDILFMNNTGFATRLNYEIEQYDGTLGTLTAWVNITQLSSNEDTMFYMYYGNPTTISQQYPEKTWDADYRGVWHLIESTGIRYDSTINHKDCTTSGTTHINSAKIGGGELFNERTDSIYTNTNVDSMSTFTIECLFAFNSNVGGSGDEPFSIPSNRPAVIRYSNNKLQVWVDGHNQIITSLHTFADTDWHYAVLVATGSQLYLYVDSILEGSVSWTGSSGTSKFFMGDNGINTDTFSGTIDETRISDIARNQSWINTGYNNINNPTQFLEVGPEVQGS
jgi:hypothetical protein